MKKRLQVPAGWKRAQLGDVMTLEYGKSLPKTRRQPGNCPVVGSAGVIGSHNKAEVKGPGIVVGRKGSIGSVTWMREDFVPIDTTYFVVLVESLVDLRWMYYLLTTEDLAKLNNATGVPGLNRNDVYALRRNFPCLPEQRAIAAVLNSIDDAIERTEAVTTATEQLREAVREELLTRGLPGWHSEWKKVPGLGTVPVDWKVVRVGEVAEVNPRRPRLDVKESAQITFLPMAAVAENCAGILSRQHRAFREVSRGYTYFEEKDVLFAKITPCLQNGKHVLATGLTGGFGFGTTEFHVIRAGPLIKPTYLFRVLTRPRNIDRCKNQFRGTAGQQRVHPETLRSLPILLPPLLEQQAIAEVLASIDNTVETSRRTRDVLTKVKVATAEALLTGQKRVPVEIGK